MQPKSGKHNGILFNSPTGRIYFLRYDQDNPVDVTDTIPDLQSRVDSYMQKQTVASELPKDILDDLEQFFAAFGPLIGAWCVWGPRTPT